MYVHNNICKYVYIVFSSSYTEKLNLIMFASLETTLERIGGPSNQPPQKLSAIIRFS